MITPAQFLKIAPYLRNYFVFIGFIFVVVTGILYAILKSAHGANLSGPQKLSLWLSISKLAFWLGIASIVCGLVYTGYHEHTSVNRGSTQTGPVQQQSGDCSANVNGDHNSTS